jgi:hypothetical protein
MVGLRACYLLCIPLLEDDPYLYVMPYVLYLDSSDMKAITIIQVYVYTLECQFPSNLPYENVLVG